MRQRLKRAAIRVTLEEGKATQIALEEAALVATGEDANLLAAVARRAGAAVWRLRCRHAHEDDGGPPAPAETSPEP